MEVLNIQRNGEALGAFTEDQVLAMVENGSLLETDLAMIPGKTDWHPVSSFIVREEEADTAHPNTVAAVATESLTYVLKDGAQTGPFTDTAVEAGLRSGGLTPSDLAWREGLPQWQPLGVLYPGQPVSNSPAPPVPPPPATGNLQGPAAPGKPKKGFSKKKWETVVAVLVLAGILSHIFDSKKDTTSSATTPPSGAPPTKNDGVEVMVVKTTRGNFADWTNVTCQVTNSSGQRITFLMLLIRAIDAQGLALGEAKVRIDNIDPGKAVRVTTNLSGVEVGRVAKIEASMIDAFVSSPGHDDKQVSLPLKIVAFDEAHGNITSIDGVKKAALGIWTGRQSDICERLIVKADGSYDVFDVGISADGWGEPKHGTWEPFTDKYSDSGKRYYGLRLSGGAYVIVESSTEMRSPNLEMMLTKGDSNPFSK